MIAEIQDPTIDTLAKDPETVPVDVTVVITAADPPTSPPAFSYVGLTTARSIWIQNEAADFTLTLKPKGFPEDFEVVFASLEGEEPRAINWRSPGKKEPVPKPDYISDPVLSPDSQGVEFTVKNTATPGTAVLISFTVGILVTGPGTPPHSFESPDPTIINVDPPGSDVS